MFRRLFAGLTGEPRRGQALFGLTVREASRPCWFVEGQVPDTVNGRFAVLATVVALTTLRLEDGGSEGRQASVGLAERLVDSLDAEIREMGVGDPALGKQVRKLVGAVGGRVERWRALLGSNRPWEDEVRRSLYDEQVAPEVLQASKSALEDLWQRLRAASVDDLANGTIG